MSRPAVLLLYVVPVLLTAAFLASVGLGALALGLLAVEVVVSAAVLLARRGPRTDPARPRSGTAVLLVGLVGVVLVGVALVLLVPR